MQRTWLSTLAALAVVTVLHARADKSPFAGNWKVLDVSSGNETALALLQIADKDGKPQAKVLAAPLLGDGVSIENLTVDDKAMQFDLKFADGVYHVKAYASKADAKTKGVRGTIALNGNIRLARFNKTDDTELTADDAESATADGEQLAKALELEDAKEKHTALQEIADQSRDNSAVYAAVGMVLEELVKVRAKEEQVRPLAEKYVKIGALFGPEIEVNSTVHVCRLLLRFEKVSPAAVELSRRLEKSLTKDAPPERSLAVLKSLATVLRRTGHADEAKDLQARVDKLEEPLDAAYAKTSLPFQPDAFKGPRGGTRIAVVELFTGAYCPPCVAADVAFDAALLTYKPRDVVLLQYHIHVPRPDRLTNADTVKRAKYYDRAINGVPTALVNGTATGPLGGVKDDGKQSYAALRGAIENALDATGGGLLSLAVERKGDLIDINAEVTQLKKPGENIKLRFALVEEVVRYPGGNGQRLHHHVVRAFVGGNDGFALTEARGRRKVAVNLAELRKSLDGALTASHQADQPFADDEYPLDLKKLKVVALIQDDDSKEILQAVQMDVPEPK